VNIKIGSLPVKMRNIDILVVIEMLVEDAKIIVAIHAKEKKEEISHHGTI
jgi:hypothetical protein